MSTSEILSLCALLVSAAVMLLSGRRDARGSAAEQARVGAKLDSIASGVDDIRVEQRAVRDRVDALAERLSRAEQSLKSTHRRLDALEAPPRACPPPEARRNP